VVVPQKELPWAKVSSDEGHEFTLSATSTRKPSADDALILSSVRDVVASGDHGLDSMLAAVADAACRLTDASGTALAMWKDGAMLCRARSGRTAPPLGAKLDAQTGISGECLRTGKTQNCIDTETDDLVDTEVCRSLGLRSIAVLPIQGWRAVNGILEVFSTVPNAFSEHHLAMLGELAALAERARAAKPKGALPVVARPPAEAPNPTGLLPASDRIVDLVLGFVGRQSRARISAAIAVVGLLFGFAFWLGWRGPRENDGKGLRLAASAVSATPVAAGSHIVETRLPGSQQAAKVAGAHLPDNDAVWKPNPGGETLRSTGAKPSPGSPSKSTSKTGVADAGHTTGGRVLLTGDAKALATPDRTAGTKPNGNTKPQTLAPTEEASLVEPPAIPTVQASPMALNGVLSPRASLPGLAVPVSQGVTGGRLLRRVPPTYPNHAKLLGVEGKVVLNALVMEDGSVHDLKVVQGDAVLAQAALEAVKQWRYQPFLLDGKPVKKETNITVDFKLPR
jgi:TonB family protein